ncbi:MAG: hypothetical protein FJ358_07510 [Thaumarchaeota archaeon]|nr:hypothetical protein [Nitrososphaerota archaeon]
MQKLLVLAMVLVLAITVTAGIGIANISQNANTTVVGEPKAKSQSVEPEQEAAKEEPIPEQIPIQQAIPEPKNDVADALPQPPAQNPRPVRRDLLGETVSLEEARNRANFTVLVPSGLPPEVVLQNVRLGSWYSSDVVSLFYSGLTVIEEKIGPNVNASLRAENAIRENQLSTSPYKPTLQRFAYAGADGFGYGTWVYVQEGERTNNPGAISFIWNGAHYLITGYRTYNELAKIALSMLQ